MDETIKHLEKESVHFILAHSYSIYFILFLVGMGLDLIFNYEVFSGSAMVPYGFVLMMLAPVVIFWAQKTGRDFKKVKEVKTEHFCRGPYCYTRIPTQWGLFFMLLGFGVVINSLFIVLSTLVSFLVFKLVFLSKHDRLLIKKYGDAYAEYKKLVRF